MRQRPPYLGNVEMDVPPEAPIKATVTMMNWVTIDDISEGKAGTALKTTLAKGEGWQRTEDR